MLMAPKQGCNNVDGAKLCHTAASHAKELTGQFINVHA